MGGVGATSSATGTHKVSMSCWFVQRCVSVFVRNSSCLWFTFIMMRNSRSNTLCTVASTTCSVDIRSTWNASVYSHNCGCSNVKFTDWNNEWGKTRQPNRKSCESAPASQPTSLICCMSFKIGMDKKLRTYTESTHEPLVAMLLFTISTSCKCKQGHTSEYRLRSQILTQWFWYLVENSTEYFTRTYTNLKRIV